MNNHAQPALHLEDVNVTFGDGDSTVRALDNVNLLSLIHI